MANDVNRPKDEGDPVLNWEPHAPPPEMPLPADPGGAHTKGYSADPLPESPAPDCGPIPLADEPTEPHAIKVRERDLRIKPTGRDEPGGRTPDGNPTASKR